MVKKFNQMTCFVPVAVKNYEQTRMIIIGAPSKTTNNDSHSYYFRSQHIRRRTARLFNRLLIHFRRNR